MGITIYKDNFSYNFYLSHKFMNFILLTDYYFPIIKSGSIIVGDLVNELSQQGHS